MVEREGEAQPGLSGAILQDAEQQDLIYLHRSSNDIFDVVYKARQFRVVCIGCFGTRLLPALALDLDLGLGGHLTKVVGSKPLFEVIVEKEHPNGVRKI